MKQKQDIVKENSQLGIKVALPPYPSPLPLLSSSKAIRWSCGTGVSLGSGTGVAQRER